jgi:hypothetical protein
VSEITELIGQQKSLSDLRLLAAAGGHSERASQSNYRDLVYHFLLQQRELPKNN